MSEEPGSAGGGAALAPPPPSSMTVTIPLTAESAGYDNERQARHLQEESELLGIERLAKPSAQSEESAESGEARETVTYEQGLQRTKDYARQFAAQRRAIDKDKGKAVDLPGATPLLLTGKRQGGPIDNASAEDGPKDLEKN
mgnify:CR=1 FL=1